MKPSLELVQSQPPDSSREKTSTPRVPREKQYIVSGAHKILAELPGDYADKLLTLQVAIVLLEHTKSYLGP